MDFPNYGHLTKNDPVNPLSKSNFVFNLPFDGRSTYSSSFGVPTKYTSGNFRKNNIPNPLFFTLLILRSSSVNFFQETTSQAFYKEPKQSSFIKGNSRYSPQEQPITQTSLSWKGNFQTTSQNFKPYTFEPISHSRKFLAIDDSELDEIKKRIYDCDFKKEKDEIHLQH